jgi:S1-C subfamily serine protease
LFAFRCVREYNALFVDPVPRFVSVFLLLLTQASVFASAAAQTKTNPGPPGVIVVGIICYLARKQPIGGWLLYYYISLYSGLALSFVLLAATIQNYSPERWQSTELYALAIESTALPQLALILQAVIATILLKRREWKWLKLLRAVLIGSVICTGITIVFGFVFFSPDQTVFDWFALIWLVIWLGYFFTSQRVKRVFLSKDWGRDVSPLSTGRAPVATATPPPTQIPLLTPNPGRPSLAASKPDDVFSQNTKTSTLIFFLCALAFCALVILWEKYHTVRPVLPVAPEIRKAIPVQNQATIDFSPLPEKPLTPAEIFRRVRPSVVLLTMQDARGQTLSLGTGFFVDENVVATNFHVIDGAAGGYAKVAGQTAKLNIEGTVAVDALHDLALLQLNASSTLHLPVAPKLSANIGDPVYAIGNPKGLEGTFSQGIVSSVRSLGSDRILQITAPISPGSSGGPVLDQSGNVVGVSFASIEKGQNLNFAIPCDYLVALQNARTALRPFTTVPRAKARTTLLDRIGNERPMAGVVGENLTYDGVGIQTGQFSFSIYNKLRDNVATVYGICIFYDVQGEPIDVYPINYRGMILAGTAKRITGSVDRSVERLNCPDGLFPPPPPRPPKAKVEFRILDFTVE